MAVVPAMAVALLVGAGTASAHGMFGGGEDLTPEQRAEKASLMFERKAEMLGLDVNVVKEAWAEGKNFRELAEEQGIDMAELKEKMQAERKARQQERLQNLVEAGVITQEQANLRLERMQEKMTERAENGDDFAGKRGGRGMHKGFKF